MISNTSTRGRHLESKFTPQKQKSSKFITIKMAALEETLIKRRWSTRPLSTENSFQRLTANTTFNTSECQPGPICFYLLRCSTMPLQPPVVLQLLVPKFQGYGNKYGQNRRRARIRRRAWMSRCSSCNKPSPLRRALVSLCCIRALLLLTCTKKQHLPWWFYTEATMLFCLVYTNIVIFLPLPSCCSCSVSLFLSLSSFMTHRFAVPVWRLCQGLRWYGTEPKQGYEFQIG